MEGEWGKRVKGAGRGGRQRRKLKAPAGGGQAEQGGRGKEEQAGRARCRKGGRVAGVMPGASQRRGIPPPHTPPNSHL